MALQCAFKLAEFPIPYFNPAIVGAGGNCGECRVESDAIDLIAVRL